MVQILLAHHQVHMIMYIGRADAFALQAHGSCDELRTSQVEIPDATIVLIIDALMSINTRCGG
jgi:hypothetical protein